MNAVEGFFAKLTRRRLKHGVFHSIVDLQAAINCFIAEHNAQPPSSGERTPTRSSPRETGFQNVGINPLGSRFCGDDGGGEALVEELARGRKLAR